MFNQKKVWIFAGLFLIALALVPQIYAAGCCLNSGAYGVSRDYYCKGSDTQETVGAEQCCAGASSCPEYITSEGCLERGECTQSTLGCCCGGTAQYPVRQDTCEGMGWLFSNANSQTECNAACTATAQNQTSVVNCDSWSILAIPEKGEQKIDVTVSACAPIPAYDIQRCDEVGANCQMFISNSINTGTHTDSNVEWDKTYTYKVISPTGSTSEKTKIIVTPGNIECLAHYSTEKFCLPSEYYLRRQDFLNFPPFNESSDFVASVGARLVVLGADFNNAPVFCDNRNRLSLAGPSCGAGACVVDKASNTPFCIYENNCSNPDLTNPFSMFYTKDSCELNGTHKKYCFFDRSESIIDSCYSCKPQMSCGDYHSESSCIADNCFLNRCTWNRTNSEFNTGVCIDATSGLNCQGCNKNENNIMENKNVFNQVFDVCNLQKAGALSTQSGYCMYSNGGAQSCLDTVCSDYNQAYCENLSTPILNNYNVFSQRSNDVCNIGACRWFGALGYCRKDADYSNQTNLPDCTLSDTTCELDYYKPITEVVPIKYYKGCPINFSIRVYDQISPTSRSQVVNNNPAYITYFCNGPACLLTPESFNPTSSTNKTTVRVNGLTFLDEVGKTILTLAEGENLVYYYTKDPSKNIGTKKNITLVASENCAYIDYSIDIK